MRKPHVSKRRHTERGYQENSGFRRQIFIFITHTGTRICIPQMTPVIVTYPYRYYSNIGTRTVQVLVPVDHTGTEVAKRRHLGEPSARPAPVFGGYLHFIAAVARQLYHSECCVHKAPSNNRVMIYLRRKTPMIRSLPSPPRARRRGRKQIY